MSTTTVEWAVDMIESLSHARREAGMKGAHLAVLPSEIRRAFFWRAAAENLGREDSVLRDSFLALDGKLDYGSCSDVSDSGHVTLDRAREVPLSVVRGKVVRCAARMVESSTVVFKPGSDAYVSVRQFYASHNGSEFVNVTRHPGADRGGGDRQQQLASDLLDATSLPLIAGAQLLMEYHWAVEILTAFGPGVVVPCDAQGVRRLLRERDVPPGKKRRANLRAFIAEHMRLSRDGERALVREHLRGARQCTWNGMDCRIMPPLAEIRRIERGELDPAPSVIDEAIALRTGAAS